MIVCGRARPGAATNTGGWQTISMGGLSGMAGRIAETGRTEATGPISRPTNSWKRPPYTIVRGTLTVATVRMRRARRR